MLCMDSRRDSVHREALDAVHPNVEATSCASHAALQSHFGFHRDDEAAPNRRSIRAECIDDLLPEPLPAPESITDECRSRLAVAGGHLAPGCWRAQHPENAGEDGAVIVVRPAHRGARRRQQVADVLPRVSGQGAAVRRQRRDAWRYCSVTPNLPRAMAASRHSLMGTPPP